MVKKKDYSIKVENVTKKFKIYSDKPNTLKERIVFFKKNKVNTLQVYFLSNCSIYFNISF